MSNPVEQKIAFFKDDRFLHPVDVPATQGSPVPFQRHIDGLIERRSAHKGNLGELFRVIHHSPGFLGAAIFDITSGQQIGYGAVHKIPDLHKRDYSSAITVGSDFQRLGIGFLAWDYLMTLNAARFKNGTHHRETVEAGLKDLAIVQRMMQRVGAIQDPKVPEEWRFRVPNPKKEVPLTVDAKVLVFKARGKELAIPEGMERVGELLLYKGIPVGEIGKRAIAVYQQENPDLQFWIGVDALWKGAKKAGLRVDLGL